MEHVDPPDLALWPTLRRLFPLWWEQRRLVGFGLACALVFTALSISIPILIKQVVDKAIVGPDQELLLPYLGAIIVLASLRFVVNFTRRFATARVGIAVEARLRGMLYHAYLTYPRAFFDRHATGEVISRATNDIYPVRYFIGWGVVQGVQSAMMITGAAIVLTIVNARLALYAALAMPPIAILTFALRAQAVPDLAARSGSEGQPRRGDGRGGRGDRDGAGVRPRGRRADALPRTGRGGPARDDARAPRSRRTSSPASSSCPRSGSPPCSFRRPRRDLGRADDRRVHALHHPPADARLAAGGTRLDHQPRPARSRVGRPQLRLARRDRADARAGRARSTLPEGPLGVRFEDVHFAYGTEAEVLRGIDLAARAGRDRRRLRPDRRRQDDAAQPPSPLLRPDRRPRARRRRRHARRRVRGAARAPSRS